MDDRQMIIKRIRDCDNCKFRPETSRVCSDYGNCYMVSEYICKLRNQLKRKKQECKELKKVGCKFKNYCTCNTEKFLQTLDTIKEIAEKAKKDICNNCAWKNTDSCDPEYYICGELIKILQKINEVLNGTNP